MRDADRHPDADRDPDGHAYVDPDGDADSDDHVDPHCDGGSLYTWSFGDGRLTQSTYSPVIGRTYDQIGAFTARVTATNSISAFSASAVVTVIDTPIVTISATSTSPTRFTEVTTFTAASAGSHVVFTWSFGDAGAIPSQRTGAGAMVTHTYSGGGAFTAIITATNGVSVVVTAVPVTIANQVYVDAAAAGAGNGLSWANAYTDVQSALIGAIAGQEL